MKSCAVNSIPLRIVVTKGGTQEMNGIIEKLIMEERKERKIRGIELAAQQQAH